MPDVMYVDVQVIEGSLYSIAVSGVGKSFKGKFGPVINHGAVRVVLPLFAASS